MPSTEYAKPKTLDEALALISAGPYRCAAGFTDIFPAQVQTELWSCTRTEAVLDLTGIAELTGIVAERDALRIGAGVTWTDIALADLPPALRALQQAAVEIGGVQIQNRGTVVGNICNASPAADAIPALVILDAIVEIGSQFGRRQIPLADFVIGNRRTLLEDNEIVTAVLIPNANLRMNSCFLKLGARKHLIISIVSTAVAFSIANGKILDPRISVGACSDRPIRLRHLEAQLNNVDVFSDFEKAVRTVGVLSELRPIDDVRGTASYRREAAAVLIARALDSVRAYPV